MQNTVAKIMFNLVASSTHTFSAMTSQSIDLAAQAEHMEGPCDAMTPLSYYYRRSNRFTNRRRLEELCAVYDVMMKAEARKPKGNLHTFKRGNNYR
jgi:hypothetical protein